MNGLHSILSKCFDIFIILDLLQSLGTSLIKLSLFCIFHFYDTANL